MIYMPTHFHVVKSNWLNLKNDPNRAVTNQKGRFLCFWACLVLTFFVGLLMTDADQILCCKMKQTVRTECEKLRYSCWSVCRFDCHRFSSSQRFPQFRAERKRLIKVFSIFAGKPPMGRLAVWFPVLAALFGCGWAGGHRRDADAASIPPTSLETPFTVNNNS